jgi:transposase
MKAKGPTVRSWKEERRRRGLALHRQGWTNLLIAEALGVSEPAVSKWVTAAERGHARAPAGISRRGQGRKLSDSQLAHLPSLLDRGAEAYGFRGDVWTCRRIVDVIKREYGIRYHAAHVSRLLHSLHWSCQRPILQSDRRDDEAVCDWLNTTWPKLRARAKTQGRTLVFVDEAGFYLTPTVARTWSPVGQTPTTRGERPHGHLSAVGGLTWDGSLYIQVHRQTVKHPEVIAFLEHLLRHLPGKLLVLWDRAKIHQNHKVDAFLAGEVRRRLGVEPFPAYAPEIDPQEYVWHQLKHVDFRNLSSSSLDQVWVRLQGATRRLRQRVGLLRNLIRHAGLEL